MKKMIFVTITLFLFAINTEAGLNDLIKQNVIDADDSYEQIISNVDKIQKTSRFWIHLRSESQKNLGKKIYQQLLGANLQDIHIEEKPLQVVDYGPQNSELRFFKKEDGPEAKKLLEVLRVLLPKLTLKDLSREYSHAFWIKRGHFELWLSQDAIDTDTTM